MATWRMAFRAGRNGFELWERCRELCVAAIEYGPLDDIDLTNYEEGEPREQWRKLSPPQQASMKRFCYQMCEGDTIYVKQGKQIVGRGTVAGPYVFDDTSSITEPSGISWQHQRKVTWERGFAPVDVLLGKQQTITLVPLDDDAANRITDALGGSATELSAVEGIQIEITTLQRSRNRKLRDRALAAANGVCAVCECDFSKVLGGRGQRVLQVHHRKPLARNVVPVVTTVKDLAVVCANCHLLLHLDPVQPLTVDELRALLVADSDGE